MKTTLTLTVNTGGLCNSFSCRVLTMINGEGKNLLHPWLATRSIRLPLGISIAQYRCERTFSAEAEERENRLVQWFYDAVDTYVRVYIYVYESLLFAIAPTLSRDRALVLRKVKLTKLKSKRLEGRSCNPPPPSLRFLLLSTR